MKVNERVVKGRKVADIVCDECGKRLKDVNAFNHLSCHSYPRDDAERVIYYEVMTSYHEYHDENLRKRDICDDCIEEAFWQYIAEPLDSGKQNFNAEACLGLIVKEKIEMPIQDLNIVSPSELATLAGSMLKKAHENRRKAEESIGIMDFEILEEMRLRKIKEADGSVYWQCDMTDWRGCIGTGDTPEEAIQSAYDALDVIKEHFWDATQGRIKGLNIISPSERLMKEGSSISMDEFIENLKHNQNATKKGFGKSCHDQEMTIKLNLDADGFITDLAKVQKAIEEFSETSSGSLEYLREIVDEVLEEDLKTTGGIYPFGYCGKCGYEFNSELINEYGIKHCPMCGEKLEQDE